MHNLSILVRIAKWAVKIIKAVKAVFWALFMKGAVKSYDLGAISSCGALKAAFLFF